ncbi:MAG: hypothetical protein JJU05_03970 [Verrucomicrobia bacterium]|nr:hypothetical protein [Verrucomicrobiota bacterium]MCH8526438.1 hypothetical protein [Kiritimatiellia bacterium]
MKKHTLLCLAPSLAFAHPGHPGPADHGDITHALLSLGTAIILLTSTWLILRANNRRKAPVPVRKDSNHG